MALIIGQMGAAYGDRRTGRGMGWGRVDRVSEAKWRCLVLNPCSIKLVG